MLGAKVILDGPQSSGTPSALLTPTPQDMAHHALGQAPLGARDEAQAKCHRKTGRKHFWPRGDILAGSWSASMGPVDPGILAGPGGHTSSGPAGRYSRMGRKVEAGIRSRRQGVNTGREGGKAAKEELGLGLPPG